MAAITVEIDPHAMLPDRYLGTSEDGPQYGPMSLYDAIIGEASARLVGVGEKVLRELVAERMQEAIVRELDARLPAIIEAAFNEEIETGDGFTPRKKTLRQIIGDRVKSQCKSGDHYNRTAFDNVVREQIDHGLKQEFAAEVMVARTAIKARVTAKAAELLAAESLREVGIR
jgi:hypothetical protein